METPFIICYMAAQRSAVLYMALMKVRFHVRRGCEGSQLWLLSLTLTVHDAARDFPQNVHMRTTAASSPSVTTVARISPTRAIPSFCH